LNANISLWKELVMNKPAIGKIAIYVMLTALAALPVKAIAQAPTQIKQNNAWGAYSHTGSDGKTCYVLSLPVEKLPEQIDGKTVDHGDVFFMLSQQPGQNVRLEPQFTAGYPLQEKSKVNIEIDGKKYVMFTHGQNAWLENPAEGQAIVASMKAGSKMKVSAISRRGTKTSYDYSLSGVTASIGDIANCK